MSLVLVSAALAGAATGWGAEWLARRLPSLLGLGDLAPPRRALPVSVLGGACLFAAAAYGQTLSPRLIALLTAGAFLYGAAIQDLRHHVLPDLLTLPFLWCGLVQAALGQGAVAPPESILGAALGWTMLASLRLVGRRVGGGDAKFAGAIGAWLGPPDIAEALVLGAGLAVVVGLARGRRMIPFGPCLAIPSLMALIGKNRAWF